MRRHARGKVAGARATWKNAPVMVEITGPFEIVPGAPPARHVRIYRPRRAEEHERPLLLLFDGQNVFDDGPSFAGGWHAHVAVEKLARSALHPIVVGIDHGHDARIAELSPFDFGSVRGRLEETLRWIVDFLIPKLRREHRLSGDRDHVTIGGSSMGGLAALYAALRRPDVFGGAIAMSPSVWVAGEALHAFAARNLPARPSRLYLDAGALEAGGRLVASVERLAGLLRATPAARLMVRIDPRGRHREADWRRRLLPALRFHFGRAR